MPSPFLKHTTCRPISKHNEAAKRPARRNGWKRWLFFPQNGGSLFFGPPEKRIGTLHEALRHTRFSPPGAERGNSAPSGLGEATGRQKGLVGRSTRRLIKTTRRTLRPESRPAKTGATAGRRSEAHEAQARHFFRLEGQRHTAGRHRASTRQAAGQRKRTIFSRLIPRNPAHRTRLLQCLPHLRPSGCGGNRRARCPRCS